MSTVGCEIAGGCGVVAVGRCRECGRAFCRTHQARSNDLLGFENRCTECQATSQARERDATQQRRAEWESDLTQIGQIADPVERFVRAMIKLSGAPEPRSLGAPSALTHPRGRDGVREWEFRTYWPGVQIAVGQEELAHWFTERVDGDGNHDIRPCTCTLARTRTTFFGSVRTGYSRPLPAWAISSSPVKYLIDGRFYRERFDHKKGPFDKRYDGEPIEVEAMLTTVLTYDDQMAFARYALHRPTTRSSAG